MTSLGEEYPKEQARCRDVLEVYISAGNIPGCNTNFAVANIKDMLSRADQAVIQGDLVEMIKCFQEMKECSE